METNTPELVTVDGTTGDDSLAVLEIGAPTFRYLRPMVVQGSSDNAEAVVASLYEDDDEPQTLPSTTQDEYRRMPDSDQRLAANLGIAERLKRFCKLALKENPLFGEGDREPHVTGRSEPTTLAYYLRTGIAR